LPATVVGVVLTIDRDAKAVGLGLVVPGVAGAAGLAVGALSDGEETGAGTAGEETGPGVTGAEVGVVDVGVGTVGEVIAVEPRFVVPGVAGPDVGVLPEGEEPGAGAAGDDVGVVDVGVGCTGDATGVGDPVGGAVVGCCGEAGVGAGVDGGAVAAGGMELNTNAFPSLSTATQGEPEKHETAFRLPRRSISIGGDHVAPL
jgi:hypothetical protein